MSLESTFRPKDEDFYENFDPEDYEGGIICHICDTPLTKANVFREHAGHNIYVLLCITCAIEGRERGI